ncbi:O-antigen polymerase [Brevundimonas sp. R86498]|uniref:O-antigen polymerase n=1 Tax=Brevundimonas sp. R86498 TaxID=3093845 RepID=UPI0037C6B859
MKNTVVATSIIMTAYIAVMMFMLVLRPDQLSIDAAIYVAGSLISGLIVLAAIFLGSKTLDPFSPLVAILFTVSLGATLRAPYMVFEQSTSAAARYQMLGFQFSDVAGEVGWYVVGVAFLVIGYSVRVGRFQLERLSVFQDKPLNLNRFLFWSAVFVGLAAVGIASYIAVHNISLADGLASLSGKRAVTIDGGEGTVYGAGWQTFVGQVARYPFAALCLALVLGRLRAHWLWIAACIVLGVLAVAIPILGNTRSGVMLLGLTLVIALYYYGKLRLRTILIVAVSGIFVIGVLTELRAQNQGRANIHGNAVDAVLGSGNGLDSYRTALIIELAPDRVGFQYGRSLAAIGSGAIPRAVWPDKPMVSMGPWVKEKIFGHGVRNNGWPPGIIAEGFLNFSYPGIILLTFVYGVFLRYYYESLRPLRGRSLVGTLFYAFTIYPLCFTAVSNNVSLGIVAASIAIFPFLAFCYLAFGAWVRVRRPMPVFRYGGSRGGG